MAKSFVLEEDFALDHGRNMYGAEVMEEAYRIINGQRQKDYGPPAENFDRVAQLWKIFEGKEESAGTVALKMAMLKIARIVTGDGTHDSYVDAIGYIALAHDLSQQEFRAAGEGSGEVA